MSHCAIDFETYYNSKNGVTLSKMSSAEYLRNIFDKKFMADSPTRVPCYLVSLAAEDFEYCECPTKAPWHRLNGRDWIMHNASFDLSVLNKLREVGVIPADVHPRRVYCTADMSVHHWGIRDLAGAYKHAFGESISKAYRGTANGKTGEELRSDASSWIQILDAGIADARACLRLWNSFSKDWPEFERDISEMTREGAMLGCHVNEELALKNIETCRSAMLSAEKDIPWMDLWKNDKKKTKTPIAARYLKVFAESIGCELPKSLNKKDPDFIKWKDRNLDRYPWLAAMQQWSEAYRLLGIHETAMKMADTDGRMSFSLIYMGANSTGRFSGGLREE